MQMNIKQQTTIMASFCLGSMTVSLFLINRLQNRAFPQQRHGQREKHLEGIIERF